MFLLFLFDLVEEYLVMRCLFVERAILGLLAGTPLVIWVARIAVWDVHHRSVLFKHGMFPALLCLFDKIFTEFLAVGSEAD